MSRRFIAAVLVASLAITGLAAKSARAADAEDIAKILGTVATLYFLGTAIQNAQGDNDRKVYVYRDRGYDRDRYDRGHRAKKLPAACLLRGWNRNGKPIDVLGAVCVERRYDQVHRLPNTCRVQAHTEKGVRVVYKTHCLKRRGFEVARR